MKPARKKKLGLIALGLVGLSVAAGLMLYALSNNINLFYPPAKVVAGEAPGEPRFGSVAWWLKTRLSEIPTASRSASSNRLRGKSDHPIRGYSAGSVS